MTGHGPNPGYIPGDHWVECSRCGFDCRASQAKKEWNGLVVCPKCWEPRHPQDFIRGRTDDQAAKGLVRPASTYDDSVTSVGDADTTLTVGTDDLIQIYSTDLTANRTVTLDTTGAMEGDQFIVQRTDSGAYDLDVGGLQTIPSGVTGQVTVEFNGTAWKLKNYRTY